MGNDEQKSNAQYNSTNHYERPSLDNADNNRDNEHDKQSRERLNRERQSQPNQSQQNNYQPPLRQPQREVTLPQTPTPQSTAPSSSNYQNYNYGHIGGNANGMADSAIDFGEQMFLDDPQNDVKHAVKKLERGVRTGRRSVKSISAVRRRHNRALFETAKPRNYEQRGRFRKKLNRAKRTAYKPLRRALSASSVAANIGAELVPDEYAHEQSGTAAVRSTTREGAELLTILATSEKRAIPSKPPRAIPPKLPNIESTNNSVEKFKIRDIEQHNLSNWEKRTKAPLRIEPNNNIVEKPKRRDIEQYKRVRTKDAAIKGKMPTRTVPKEMSRDEMRQVIRKTNSNIRSQGLKPQSVSLPIKRQGIAHRAEQRTNYRRKKRGHTPQRDTLQRESNRPKHNPNAPRKLNPRRKPPAATPPPQQKPPPKTYEIRRNNAPKGSANAASNATKSAKSKASDVAKGIVGTAANKAKDTVAGVATSAEEAIASSSGNTLPINLRRYAVQKVSNYNHEKISEVENDDGNVGLKATHSMQRTGGRLIRGGRNIRQAQRRYTNAKRKKTEIKAGVKKTKTTAAVAGKKVKAVAVKAKTVAIKAKVAAVTIKVAVVKVKAAILTVKSVVGILILGWKVVLVILLIALQVLIFVACISMLASMGATVIAALSFHASDDDLTRYSVRMTELQVNFVEDIHETMMAFPTEEVVLTVNGARFVFAPLIIHGHGGVVIDGTRHEDETMSTVIPAIPSIATIRPLLPNTSHCQIELMAYLTVRYGDFTEYDINAALEDLFDEVFQFTYTTYTREQTVTVEMRTYISFLFSLIRIAPYSTTQQVPVFVTSINVTSNGTISSAIRNRLNEMPYYEDENPYIQRFEALLETHGLRQFVGSPFENDWTGSLSSPYGYRFHPVYGVRCMHTGIDIGMPTGTPLLGGLHNGIVTQVEYMGGYGNTVIMENTCERTGMRTRVLYAHMDTFAVSVGDVLEMGQQIGTVGMTGTATGPHLHIEIFVMNENETAWRRLNPVFFLETQVFE
ncbi:MAG: M23 family metallopeptidase [Defluviitaleaceae bacterium]|nr:M23 family metallopeptidase [Defluviitaleaceae bacterium]